MAPWYDAEGADKARALSVASVGFGGWMYGDGSDGAHVCTDGEVLTTGNYTDFTIPAGVTVTVPTFDYRLADSLVVIRCTGTYTINGTVDLAGADAVGRLAPDPVFNATTGDGATVGVAQGIFPGGKAGSGAAGPAGDPVETKWLRDPLPLLALSRAASGLPMYDAGPGSGDNTNYGGASGSSGKWFMILARTLAHGPGNQYLIQGGHGAPGGDDGTGSTGHGDCGGGAGGGIGWWMTISDLIVGTAGVVGTHGLGATGCGTGTVGGPGSGTPGESGIHLLNQAA